MRALALIAAVVLAAVWAPAAHAATHRSYLLALGDSYAAGGNDDGGPLDRGPAEQLLPLARARGYRFTLVKRACMGATSGSMLGTDSCSAGAAANFIRHHRGHVGLVTVSIGGNDLLGCFTDPDPLACVAARMPAVQRNVAAIAHRLRTAGGRRLRIVGSSYPDILLGAWVRPDRFGDGRFTFAAESITADRELINPGLRAAYRSAGARFVDVARATGAYGPFTTTNDPTYGTIPVPVAKVCRLTFFCSLLGVHMTTAGYGVIAQLEAATLPRRHH